MTVKVLTPAEVARRSISTETDEPYSLKWYEYQIQKSVSLSETGYQDGLVKALEWVSIISDSHEALRAENARLRGLIEGMVCEFDCESYVRQSECTGYGKCNCIRSKVDL